METETAKLETKRAQASEDVIIQHGEARESDIVIP
jgi:hypothetical protein